MMHYERFIELIQLGAFAVIGGMAKQCQAILRGAEVFSLARFSMHLGLAVFAGVVAGSFIPEGVQYRDGFILMIGYTAQPILDILEHRVTLFFKGIKP